MDDPFYIGYHERAPEAVRRRVRGILGLLVLLLAASVALLVRAQQYDTSSFDFGNIQTYQGVYVASPVPHLRSEDQTLLLVGPGKHAATINAPSGSPISLSGTEILRDGSIMVEVVPGSEETLGAPVPQPAPTRVGAVRLRGEIVGSKCFLGVMNPGHGTVHRACARHCILGGVPPILHSTSANGEVRTLLRGLSEQDFARLAGQPVVVEGVEWSLQGLNWVEIRTATPVPAR